METSSETSEELESGPQAEDDGREVEESTTGDEDEPEVTQHTHGETFRKELDADPSMVEDFLKEANQHLNQLDNLLVEAEKDPTENTLGELFRSMHTLKGGFGFCGLERYTDITHGAEDLLDALKQDPPPEIPAVWMDLFFDTLDTIRGICTALEEAVEEDSPVIDAEVSPRSILNSWSRT